MRAATGYREYMINGAHLVIHSRDAEADRVFLRDVLGWPHVDAGGGWLIFKLPPAEIAVHPGGSPSHELFLMCDDVDATVRELAARGVEVLGPVEERRFGRLARIRVPGAGELTVYEPSHPTAIGLQR